MERGNESLHKWSRSMTIKKPSNLFSITRSPMILKLCKQHRELEVYKVYIKDGPVLTLTYFTAWSNLPAYAFKWENLLQSPLKRKLAAKDQIDRRFMFLKKNTH